MNRRFHWAILVVVGMALGYALHSDERTGAVLSPRSAYALEQDADLAGQLTEIKTQVKEINTLLRSGTLRVVVVINPDSR